MTVKLSDLSDLFWGDVFPPAGTGLKPLLYKLEISGKFQFLEVCCFNILIASQKEGYRYLFRIMKGLGWGLMGTLGETCVINKRVINVTDRQQHGRDSEES